MSLELIDGDADFWDRSLATASRDSFYVQGKLCKEASFGFWGGTGNWANVAPSDTVAQGGRGKIDCTRTDGTKHRYWYGWTKFNDPLRTDCLVLRRTSAANVDPTQYTVSTPVNSASCPARHELLNRDGSIELVGLEDLPFDSIYRLSGAVPVA